MAEPRCIWKDTEDGFWETSCRQEFVIEDGTPSQNCMKFCCFCGEPLVEEIEQEPPHE